MNMPVVKSGRHGSGVPSSDAGACWRQSVMALTPKRPGLETRH